MVPTSEDVIQQTRAQMLAIVNSASTSPTEKTEAGSVLAKMEASLLIEARLRRKEEAHLRSLALQEANLPLKERQQARLERLTAREERREQRKETAAATATITGDASATG